GERDLALGRRAEAGAVGGGARDRLEDLFVRVAGDERPPRADVVDVLVAVDVEEIRPLAAREEDRLAADAAEGAHRRVHAAGDVLLGALEELVRSPATRRRHRLFLTLAVVVAGVRLDLDGVVVLVARQVLFAFDDLDRRRLHLAGFVLALGERLDGDHVLALVDAHQPHALRVTAQRRDALDRDADDLAAVGDEHEVLLVGDEAATHDLAVALGGLDGDDAEAAAALDRVLGDRGALAVAVLAHGHERGRRVAREGLAGDDLVLFAQADALDAARGAAHGAHLLLGEADGAPVARGEQDIVLPVGEADLDEVIALVDGERDDARGADVREHLERGLLDHAVLRRHDDELAFLELLERQHLDDLLVLLELEEVDERLAARRARAFGQLVHALDVDAALGREHEDVIVRRGDEELRHEVFVLGRRAGDAAPAALLRAVGRDRVALDVAAVADGDHHVLVGDQLLDGDLAFVVDDLGAALVGELGADGGQLLLDHRHQPAFARQDRFQAIDGGAQRLELFVELLALEAGQALEAHVEDRLCLALRERVVALLGALGDLFFRPSGAAQELLEPGERLGHEVALGLFRRRRGADDLDDAIDVVDGDDEAFDDLLPRARLFELEQRAACDHVAAMLDEVRERVLDREDLRLPVDDGEHGHAERRLQLGHLVQVVQDDRGHRVLAQLEDDAHAVSVRLVADVADALELLVLDELGHLLDEARLDHHVRDLGDDDRGAALLVLFDLGLAAHDDRAAAGLVGEVDALASEDEARGREVRPRDELHELVDGRSGVVDERDRAVDDLADVVRRDVGRHADGDAGGAVDEEV